MLMVVFFGVLAHAQGALRVRVLSGKSGKPVSGRNIMIYSAEAQHSKAPMQPILKGRTDQSGVFTTAVKLPERIIVGVEGRYLCERRWYGAFEYRVDDILSVGVVQSNLCNPKMLRSPVPGELILFVRRESIKELLDLD
jgi:hypothetical protein